MVLSGDVFKDFKSLQPDKNLLDMLSNGQKKLLIKNNEFIY